MTSTHEAHSPDSLWKIIESDGQPELFDAVGGHLVTFIDENKPLYKQAASDVVNKSILEQYRPPKDFFLGHAISHGDSEWYSYNKNGDFWPEEENKKRAHTFVQYGAYYPEHVVKKETRKGIIKAAFHNPKMHWTEVVFWGHKKKAAADYEDAKAGKPRSYSISAHVQQDECSICKNKARNKKEYCQHAKHMLTTYVPGINKFVYLTNHHPTFYDLSDVAKPADRVAVTLGYGFSEDDLKKAAAHNGVIPSAFLAENMGIGQQHGVVSFPPSSQALLKHAREMNFATEEKQLLAFLSDEEMNTLREIRPRTLFSKMAKAGAVLPFPEFVAYITGKPLSAVAADSVIRKKASENPDYETSTTMPSCSRIFDAFSVGSVNPPDPCFDIHQRSVLNKTASFFAIDSVAGINTEGFIKRACLGTPVGALNSQPLFSNTQIEAFHAAHGIYKLACANEISLHHGSSFLDSTRLKAIIQM